MGIEILSNAKLYMAGSDFTGQINSLALAYGAETQEATVFGDTGRRRLAGLPDVNMSQAGFFDAEITDADLHTNIGVNNVPVTVAPNAGTEGLDAFFFQALHGEYTPGGTVGELLAYTVTAQGSGGLPLIKGTILGNGEQTATGQGTAFNTGAVTSTQKLFACMHVLAVSGTDPTLDVTIDSDALVGMGTPETQLTFAQAIAVGSEYATPVAGPITDIWNRIDFIIGGTDTPTFTFVVTMGIK